MLQKNNKKDFANYDSPKYYEILLTKISLIFNEIY